MTSHLNVPAPDSPAPGNAVGEQGGIARTRGILGRLVLLSVVVLLIGQIVIAWFALDGFERALEPQLKQKADVVGRTVASQFKFVVDDLAIPPHELVQVDAFLDQILATNADIEYLLILDASKETLFSQGLTPWALEQVRFSLSAPEMTSGTGGENFIDHAFPIDIADGSTIAVLHVGVSREYVRDRLSEIVYEVITVILVSLLVTLEFLMFFMSVRVSGPMERIETTLREGARGMFGNHLAQRGRDEIGELVSALNRVLHSLKQRYEDFRFNAREIEDAQIDKDIARRIHEKYTQVDDRYRFTGGMELRARNAMQIRIPIFLFMFAEELPRSFLPLFVGQFSPMDSVVSDKLLIGLPIALFMLAAAIMVPFAGELADRFGGRRVFLAGVIPAALGYVGTFLAQNYYELIAWRVLSGVGYGLIFIAAQVWVAENTNERNRAQGMVVFVGAVFTATICGPSIGGILADRIGFDATFLISAMLAMVSGLIVYTMLEDATHKPQPTRLTTSRGTVWQTLFSDRRLLAVTLFAAVPGKLILAGFLFYLAPLYLSELGNRQAAIGWMMMMYGVATLVCMPLAARFADRFGRHIAVVGAGGAVAGLGCFASLFETAVGGASNAVVIAIIALGVGHALSLTSQLAIVQDVADRHRRGLGQASVISAYRLVERAGMVFGPILAGALAVGFGYRGAIIGIGAIVLASTIVYAGMNLLQNPRRVPGGETA